MPHKSLLVTGGGEQHATVVASLFRARLAVSSELPKGSKLAESSIKNLTGGDRLAARRMREDEWSFNPTHTFAVLTNHLPEVSGLDEGIWRRLTLVPWSQVIPPNERNANLTEELKAESEGILTWIVEGARRFLDGGLATPEVVAASSQKYRASQDVVGGFIADKLKVGLDAGVTAGQMVTADEIREALDSWVGVNPEISRVPTQIDVGGRLKSLGATSVRRQTDGGRQTFWSGVQILDKSDDS